MWEDTWKQGGDGTGQQQQEDGGKWRTMTMTRDSRAMTGSSSENEEGSGKWKWDGENWWFRVYHRGPINSRLRRQISRAVKTTVDETKKWSDDLFSTQVNSRMVRNREAKSTAIQNMGR